MKCAGSNHWRRRQTKEIIEGVYHSNQAQENKQQPSHAFWPPKFTYCQSSLPLLSTASPYKLPIFFIPHGVMRDIDSRSIRKVSFFLHL